MEVKRRFFEAILEKNIVWENEEQEKYAQQLNEAIAKFDGWKIEKSSMD